MYNQQSTYVFIGICRLHICKPRNEIVFSLPLNIHNMTQIHSFVPKPSSFISPGIKAHPWDKLLLLQLASGPVSWSEVRPRGPFLTLPLVENFDPSGEFVPRGWILSPGGEVVPWEWSCPLGVKLSVHPCILLKNGECSPPGVDEGVFPLGDKFYLSGPSSRLGSKASPLGVKTIFIPRYKISYPGKWFNGAKLPNRVCTYVCRYVSGKNSQDEIHKFPPGAR
jgi:hypothetical protein